MNERMWEIAEAAKDQGPNFHYYDPVFLIEYTRLIVEECANVLDVFNKENMVEEGVGGEYLKEHFGIEE